MPILTYHNGRLRFEYSNNGTFAVGGVSMKIHDSRGEEGRGVRGKDNGSRSIPLPPRGEAKLYSVVCSASLQPVKVLKIWRR